MGYIPLKPTVSAGAVVTAQSLEVGASVVAFAAFNSNTDMVEIQVGPNDVLVTFDGTSPAYTAGSSSNGGVMYGNQKYTWNVNTARFARFKEFGSSSSLFCQEMVSATDATALRNVSVLSPRMDI